MLDRAVLNRGPEHAVCAPAPSTAGHGIRNIFIRLESGVGARRTAYYFLHSVGFDNGGGDDTAAVRRRRQCGGGGETAAAAAVAAGRRRRGDDRREDWPYIERATIYRLQPVR